MPLEELLADREVLGGHEPVPRLVFEDDVDETGRKPAGEAVQSSRDVQGASGNRYERGASHVRQSNPALGTAPRLLRGRRGRRGSWCRSWGRSWGRGGGRRCGFAAGRVESADDVASQIHPWIGPDETAVAHAEHHVHLFL